MFESARLALGDDEHRFRCDTLQHEHSCSCRPADHFLLLEGVQQVGPILHQLFTFWQVQRPVITRRISSSS